MKLLNKKNGNQGSVGLTVTLTDRIQWSNMYHLQREKGYDLKMLWSGKIAFKCQHNVKIFWKRKNSKDIILSKLSKKKKKTL